MRGSESLGHLKCYAPVSRLFQKIGGSYMQNTSPLRYEERPETQGILFKASANATHVAVLTVTDPLSDRLRIEMQERFKQQHNC